jgi:uncharacterized RDD family membrane protein YckC
MSTDEDPFAKPPQQPGQEPPQTPLPPPPAPTSPYDVPGGTPAADMLTGMPPLANRGRRLLARIVDTLVVGFPVYAIMGAAFDNYDYSNTGASYAESVIYAFVYLAYQVTLLTRSGQSLGKMLLKVRVGMLADGSHPTPQAALKRESVYALSPIVPCCGSIFWVVEVLWCTWDRPYRQCLHDKTGQTVVVSAV